MSCDYEIKYTRFTHSRLSTPFTANRGCHYEVIVDYSKER